MFQILQRRFGAKILHINVVSTYVYVRYEQTKDFFLLWFRQLYRNCTELRAVH
jgi:hypothetical protein